MSPSVCLNSVNCDILLSVSEAATGFLGCLCGITPTSLVPSLLEFAAHFHSAQELREQGNGKRSKGDGADAADDADADDGAPKIRGGKMTKSTSSTAGGNHKRHKDKRRKRD